MKDIRLLLAEADDEQRARIDDIYVMARANAEKNLKNALKMFDSEGWFEVDALTEIATQALYLVNAVFVTLPEEAQQAYLPAIQIAVPKR